MKTELMSADPRVNSPCRDDELAFPNSNLITRFWYSQPGSLITASSWDASSPRRKCYYILRLLRGKTRFAVVAVLLGKVYIYCRVTSFIVLPAFVEVILLSHPHAPFLPNPRVSSFWLLFICEPEQGDLLGGHEFLIPESRTLSRIIQTVRAVLTNLALGS
ncbi:hypothetical protein EV401DRAFT_753610 [Pisolithus croceorrhizus]|nr:hypothetical protein EV401DRAFT_753610 [Pisolithus croceorrhizus]